LNRVQNWADEELVEEHERVDDNEDGTLKPLNVRCHYCKKKGHTITQCTKLQQPKGKGNGKGDGGKGSKGKGKTGKDGKGPGRASKALRVGATPAGRPLRQ